MAPYTYPTDIPIAADFSVQVNGESIFVHDSPVGAFAGFAFSGRAEVTIETNRPVGKVDVRPKARGIDASIDGNVIRFTLTAPAKLSIEIDQDITRPLLLFADAPETDAPSPGDPGVRYFEAGQVHQVGELTLASDETLYIEAGAVVQGVIRAEGASNVSIRGRGLLDARPRQDKKRLIEFTDCRNVTIEGVTIVGSYGWTVVPVRVDGLAISNIKLIGWRDNDDGIDVVSSRNVTIDDCFLRTKDDCIVIKALEPGPANNVEHVHVSRCVIWNAEWGNAMEIGFELQCDRVCDVSFRDCDIIRVQAGGVFTIHNGDCAVIQNIRIEDIRIEDARDKLIELRVGLSKYSADCPHRYHRSNPNREKGPWGQWVPTPPEDVEKHRQFRGRISNVRLANISLTGEHGLPHSLIQGYVGGDTISDVSVSSLRLAGRDLKDAASADITVTDAQPPRFDTEP